MNIKCKHCNTTKPESEFYKKDHDTGRMDSTCKSCRIEVNRENRLGVTNADYWAMYHRQDGKCGICLRRLYSKRYKAFCVDHVHETGEVRGLLCHNCNRGIGLLKDSPMNLMRAIKWIEGIVRSPEQSGK